MKSRRKNKTERTGCPRVFIFTSPSKASEKLRKKPLNLAYYARDKFKIYPREQKILCLREILRITKQKYAQAGQASPPSRFFTSSVKNSREITTQKKSPNFARQTRGKEFLNKFKCFLSKFYTKTKEILYLGEILRVTKRKIGAGWTSQSAKPIFHEFR